MAKPKTKPIPFANSATEESPGYWTWELAGRKWFFDMNDRGPNTGIIGDSVVFKLVHVDTMQLAGMFSEGYNAGFNDGVRAQGG